MTSVTKSVVDGRSKVVVDIDTCPLTHGLDEGSAKSAVQVGAVGDQVTVRRFQILPFCKESIFDHKPSRESRIPH